MNLLRKAVVLFSLACAMVAIGAGGAISAATGLGDVGAGPSGVKGGSLVDSGTRLGPGDPGGADFFGSNVAIEKDLAVIGAVNADNALGAAYVFERKKGAWVERTKLVATDRLVNSEFGENVSISGNTIAIGAPSDRNGKGAVYLFQKTGNVWTQQAKLMANDETEDSFFGDSIALRDDVLVSGAELGHVPGGVEAGAAYVFRRIGKAWTQEAKLIASDPTDQANFGSGTAIVSDNTIAIGAASAQGSGVVYFFERQGEVWREQSQLVPSSPEAGQGFGINIGSSGNSLVVGAYAAAGADDAPTGAAYVYRRTGAVWAEEARLVPSETQVRLFATRVAISGQTIVVGAPFNEAQPPIDGGSAWVFQRVGDAWVTTAKLKAPDATPNDVFGGYVAIDGKTILIGAEGADGPAGPNEGAAYVFELSGGH
jgi:hypothetical protein